MIKRTDAVDSWYMVDNKRLDNSLFADLSQAEVSVDQLDFVENGFVLKQSTGWGNSNGGSFIYMAFAADPTTVEPTLEDSFNTVIYSGTGTGVGVTNSITGVGFQPDLVWVKSRTSGSFWHNLANSVRGVNRRLFSNTTNAEDYDSSGTFNLLSFDNDGFTVGRDNNYNDLGTNNYVAWNWKGAELPAINSNGSIPSVVSANPAAGFSIVSYTTQSSGTATVGHGLNAEPNVVLVKTTGVADSWRMYHSSLGAGYQIYLNLTNAAGVTANQWNNTAPTSSVFSLGTDNAGSHTTIAYCFAEVAGFSKFGSYTGVIASGNPINVGFEPAFILVKRYNATENWVIFDNKRGSNFLMADRSDAEILASSNAPVFTATGFYFGGTSTGWNSSGNSYIYMAFANQF